MGKARITRAMRDTGIRFVRVKTPEQARNIGIHLLRPDQRELEQAVDKALRDTFPAIYIHDVGTWGYQHGYHRKPDAEQLRSQFKLIQGGAA